MKFRIYILLVLGMFIPEILCGQTAQIDIPRIEMMSNQPSPYSMRDWKQVAINYDRYVYDLSLTGEFLPFLKIENQGNNYPERQFFTLPTYVGSNDPERGEAINILPSLVGASLVGVDKSNQNGNNFVLMAQDFFNKKNGQNLYLNGNSSNSGHDWWYDMMPNLFFYQLYDLYPNMGGDAEFQFSAIAEKMLEAVKVMGGSASPWSHPYMTYRAWKFETMEPLMGGVTEPEAAGVFAWLLYHAYLESGEEKYRIGAEWAMEYLNSLTSNPSYELMLPYGTYVAAKMNAEVGTNYDIEKMVNWSFDRGSLRGWGTIADVWSGIEVSGLVGESETNTDYAFQLNGVQQAAALVPMVRYDKRFARAIGKWMLNLANSTRLFYHSFLPSSLQDGSDWSEDNDPFKVIGYEALKEDFNGLSPYATGDAVRGEWAKTNLALYGTSSIGYLGSMISTTDVDKILKIDLNKTDFFSNESYPSFLYFNPHNVEKTITINIGNETRDIYDPLSETFIASNVVGNVSITIAADQAVMPVIVPANGAISYEQHKMLIDNVVVDYDQHAQAYSKAVRIKALAAEQELQVIDDEIKVYSTVEYDGDFSELIYEWILNGTKQNESDSIFVFRASELGNYQLQCIVSAGEESSDTARITFDVLPEIEEPPIILAMLTEFLYASPGAEIEVSCLATDVNGGSLSYSWESAAGSITATADKATWTLPQEEGVYKIKVEVTDESDLTSAAETTILVRIFAKKDGEIIADYPLAGNADDYSGNELNGNLVGVILTTGYDDTNNAAYFFNGTTHHVKVDSDPKLNFTEAISVSLWFNPDQLPERESFLISHGSWQNRWKASITPENRIRWTVKTASGVKDLDSKTQLVEDQFYHATLTFDGEYMMLYVDGTLESFVPMTGQIKTTSLPLFLAQSLPDEQAYNFRGILDEVKIFDFALTPEEAKLLYETGVITSSTNAVSIQDLKIDLNPNPVTDQLNVSMKDESNIDQVMIFNLHGKLILQEKVKLKHIVIPFDAYQTGIYFIQFRQDGQILETQKIIKH
ncbi:LamG-like jellyroll fold domain-containing protein [Portibacter lacus]|uniref:Ig-like domain-containing protein n=1 Tax=Portibacter lacus TaxID=1099794 RepID=A0AA37SNX0_9BACT|nr:LamG-like jellyroll fold domain-containing protein [Portibacter lacus]GLR17140.1 hypothetical protein GCM10007940_17550 [Portibacter lacus]